MKFKHIHFIINPAAAQQEPILSLIHQALKDTKTDWDVSLTKPNLDAGQVARKLIGQTDLIVVYGGDGCVTTVAAALHGSNTPLAILPGGTANVMAKELGIPLDTKEALTLLQKGKHRLKAIDMGTVNNEPFLLRVNLGIMADMVIQADRSLKDQIGQLAYGVSTVKTIAQANPVNYRLKIDTKIFEASGVSLTITNSGNMGFAGMELQPGISVNDGLLDVILMKNTDLTSLLEVAGAALLQRESDTLLHWKGKKIEIQLEHKQDFIYDDALRKAKKLKIEVVPKSLRVIVPC